MPENIPDFQLVPTKLNRPAIDSRWIVRPRLISALDDAFGRKLTLISAPAGYGKTTLAAQWLDHIPHPSAWLSLDEHDSDPDRFLRYMIASIRKIIPQFGLQIDSLLSSSTLPPLEYLTDALILDLVEPVKPWVLVLDDFQFIRSKPMQLMLSRLVNYLPDLTHLVIATRVDPWLPLAKWRATGWLTEIRADHLRFYPEEARDYFGKPFEGQLSEAAIDQITARTEGWVTGLQLARFNLADKDDPEAFARRFAGSDRIVVDYLMDEVSSGQPDGTKHFFAMTSLLERFCAPLCDHISGKEIGMPESQHQIALLEKQNMFIIPLDGEGIWYRYHHLFRTVLNSRMKTILPQNRQDEILRRAGEWFAGRGYIEDGLRHLILSGDVDAAAGLVGENMHAAMDQDLSRRTMGRWLDLFPEGSEKRRPELLVAHAFQKMFRWDQTGAKSLLDQAESLLKDPATSVPAPRLRNLLGDIATLRASIFFWQGDAENSLYQGCQGLKLVPKKHHYAHTVAMVYTAISKAVCGHEDDGLFQLTKALVDDCSEGSPNASQLLVAKIGILSYAVDWDGVEETAKLILNFHETAVQADNWLGYAYYFLGTAAYERNLLNDAMDHFSRVEKMRYRVTTRLYHDALIGLALTAWAKADADSAKSYAETAYSFAIETNDPLSMQMSNLLQTRRMMFSINGPKNPAPCTPTSDSTWVWLLYPSLVYAENRINKAGHCRAGLESIERGLLMARHHHNTRLALQYMAVKAVALEYAGRRDQALVLLEKTLGTAKPRGLMRLFVDRGPIMAELLTALSDTRSEDAYLKVLLEAFKDTIPPKASNTSAAGNLSQTEPAAEAFPSMGLTNREHEILILLGRRLSNKEIAQQLYISPITVKTHTVNIYRKLKVHKRRQAVARAVQMGLLNQ